MEDLKQLFAIPDYDCEEGGEGEEIYYDPIYETIPESLTQHWILNVPTKSVGKWKGFNLAQVIKSAEPHREWREDELQQIHSLSETLTKMRKGLIENPLQSDCQDFLLYLALLKKVSHFYHNNSAVFDNPLSRETRECSLILFEYINFCLFTIQKYYHSYLRAIPSFTDLATEKINIRQLQHASVFWKR